MQWRIVVKDGIIVEVEIVVGVEVVVAVEVVVYCLSATSHYTIPFYKTVTTVSCSAQALVVHFNSCLQNV